MTFQDIKVKELAFRTGISQRTLEGYLGARASIPPADIAVKIAQVLGVSVEYLILGDSKKNEEFEQQEFKKIFALYHRLNHFNRKTVDDILQSLVSRQ